MQTINRYFVRCCLFTSVIFLANVSAVQSQQITRVAPSNTTLRGISIADFEHTMVVGDSATVLINADTISGTKGNFILISVPIAKSYAFYGISYYDSLHALIVGDAGKILKTNDKGKNWLQPSSGTSNALRAITHIYGSIFQIVGDGGTILRSTDSGSSWTNIKSGTGKALYAEAFGSDSVGFAAGESGTMLKTTNSGLNWTLQTQASDRNLNFYGIVMLNDSTAKAVGDSGLYRYTNDGKNWKTKKDSNTVLNTLSRSDLPAVKNAALRCIAYTGFTSIATHSTPVFPTVRSIAPAEVILGDGDLYWVLYNRFFTSTVKKKSDTTWTQYDSILSATSIGRAGDADGGNDGQVWRLNCIAVYHSGSRFLLQCAGQYGLMTYSIDSTLGQWIIETNPIWPSFDNFLFASFDTTGYGYSTETGNIVRRTTDNGYTWKDASGGEDVSGVYCKDSSTVFVAGWGGGLYRTTNSGVKWDTVPPTISQYNSLHGFAFTSPTTGLCVGDGGTVLRTFDGGNTWKNNTPPIPSFFKAIAFSNADTGVAVGDNGSMMNTSDGGASWVYNGNQPLAYPDSANLRYIQAFPNGLYYVGSNGGILKSTDYGQNWQLIYLPPDSGGISFYNSQIGIVGLYSTSSKLVPDSMTLVYTTDGLKTTYQFTVPFHNVHRLIAHWLNECSFLLYGIDGFIMKVNFCGVNAVAKTLSLVSAPIRVYPNPSLQKVTVDYQTEEDGPVTIELCDELGKEVATLYIGTETQGSHTRVFTLNSNLHGTFFIRVTGSGKVKTLRMIKL